MYSESGNLLYDVKVKVDSNTASTIRFMIHSNSDTTSRDNLYREEKIIRTTFIQKALINKFRNGFLQFIQGK